ncbi:TetR/AcrR family transcriptional regulator [Congregibacter brevis]|uniref:TetR/AcrR family transcriptional regulator n=1 Tax=Congregibacter brevis TaxID=3081201 RepID=A0ABZ0IHA2_9GAMM|nr:TetR/AcrR family transcriptional regulator [Congregibacter sp. IMCC45268]
MNVATRPTNNPTTSRNAARSSATRTRLIDSTIEALVDLGFAKTTGVEVCRRSELTRGALNHHFPDFADLLVETLQVLYARLLEVDLDAEGGVLEKVLLSSYERVTQPEFKAVIELWLASCNDPEFGARLAAAIQQSAVLFSPAMVLSTAGGTSADHEDDALYFTITETLIGIGLGRAVGRGEGTAHEASVLGQLRSMAREYDRASLAAESTKQRVLKT